MLEEDYKAYEEATFNLRRLLETEVKLDEENQELYSQVNELSANKTDWNKVVNEVDNTVDVFISESGDVTLGSGDVIQYILKLNESINSIINQREETNSN